MYQTLFRFTGQGGGHYGGGHYGGSHNGGEFKLKQQFD